VSYRPSKREPKGTWARHLHAQRKARDLSAVAAFELVYQRIGWSPKSRTAYVAIDMGDRPPKPEEATVLGAEFGWPPDPQDIEEDTTLAAALTALAAELRESRLAREAIEARLRAVEAELRSLRGRPTGGGLPEQSAPLA